LNERRHALIADFGSSHFQSDDATPPRESATVHYAAPEQCDERMTPTPKSDVCSFGLILYEILADSPVFSAAESPFAVIRRLRARDLPELPARCGSFMQELVRRCWLKDPEDRPSFGNILGDFRRHDFNIVPNAAATDIRDFCEAIVDWQLRAGLREYSIRLLIR
jgi:serine/threonine protein kinase